MCWGAGAEGGGAENQSAAGAGAQGIIRGKRVGESE